ncbi:hypothetical protein Tco_0966070 [Tanacetum coccineum]
MEEDVENENSNVSTSNEPVLLNTSFPDKDECFDPGDDIDEIDVFLAMEVSTNIEEGYYDSEGDVIFLENLLSNDTTHNLSPEVFFNHEPQQNKPENDTLITFSPKSDPLHHELAGKIITLPSRIAREHEEYLNHMVLLCGNSSSRSLENFHVNPSSIIESLPTSLIPVQEEIDIFTGSDGLMTPGIENDDYDLEGDICFLEELPNNNLIPLPEHESPNLDHQDNPSTPRPPPEPPDVEIRFEPDTAVINNFDVLNKDACFNLEEGEIDVLANIEDDDSFIVVIQTFLPYLTYPVDSLFLFFSNSEDTILTLTYSLRAGGLSSGWNFHEDFKWYLVLEHIILREDTAIKIAARKPHQPTVVTDEESVKKKTVPLADKSKKPAPAKQTKPVKEKSTKLTSSKKASKGKVLKVRKGKRSDRLVDEEDVEPQPDSEPQVEDDEYNLQRGIQMSLESFQPPVSGVAIRKPASGVTRSLLVVEGKGKDIAIDKQAAQSLLELQQPKKKSTTEQYIFQRRTLVTEEASRPSAEPQDDTSANVVHDTPSPADAETSAATKNLTVRLIRKYWMLLKNKAGSNLRQSYVALAGPNPEPMHEDFIATLYPKVHESLKHTTEKHVFLENQPSSSKTLSSIKNLDDAFTFGDQFIDDKSPEDEPGKATVDTEVESMVTCHLMYKHQSLHLQPATTTTILSLPPPPPPPQQSITVLELGNRVSALEKICANFEKKHKLQGKTTNALSSRVFTLENHDLYSKIDNYVNETVKEVVHNALQAPICDRFRELSEFEMKEILHDWMFEIGSYRSHLEHATLYEALEASMDRENGEEFIEATAKSRKRRHDDQDPPPPPPKDSDQSKKKRHESDASASK